MEHPRIGAGAVWENARMSEPRIAKDGAADAEGILVGGQIRDLRKAKGLTIAELAERIDRSVGYVSQIERNLSELSIPDLKRRRWKSRSAGFSTVRPRFPRKNGTASCARAIAGG
jgi:hypothetical protein